MTMPAQWTNQLFRAYQAQGGGVVRRSVRDVLRMGLMEEIVGEARQRGFHVIESGDQLVVLCNGGEMTIHC